MRAWVVRELGSASIEEVEPPELGDDPNAVLIDVAAGSVNFADSLVLQGTYQERPELPFVPGLEVAGTVRASNSPEWERGDEVVGLTTGGSGSWAEVAYADGRQLVRRPDDVTVASALGLHANAQTAWFCLHKGAHVRPGEVVLVHAAAGGVGSMTVQLAVEAGATVIGTSSAGKRETVERLGAHHWLDNRDPDWPDAVRELTGDVDVVVDVVGGDVFAASWKLLNFEGRVVTAGFASGDVPTVKANHTLVKNVSLVGIYWGRYTLEKPAETREAATQIWDVHRGGRLDPLVTVEGDMTDALTHSAAVAGGGTTGKIVLRW